jgi:hypothetical protein
MYIPCTPTGIYMYGKFNGRENLYCCTPTGIYMYGKSHGRERLYCCTPTGTYMCGKSHGRERLYCCTRNIPVEVQQLILSLPWHFPYIIFCANPLACSPGQVKLDSNK